jgi:hypothetical protein
MHASKQHICGPVGEENETVSCIRVYIGVSFFRFLIQFAHLKSNKGQTTRANPNTHAVGHLAFISHGYPEESRRTKSMGYTLDEMIERKTNVCMFFEESIGVR